MNAYSEALADTGTTMVLSPTSEFFRYFNNSSADVKPAASAVAPAVPVN
jgi:membrane protease subunit HflC